MPSLNYPKSLDFYYFYKLRGVFCLCAVKSRRTLPFVYEVLDRDAMKSEISPHFSVAKHSYVVQSGLVEVIQCILYKQKIGCQ